MGRRRKERAALKFIFAFYLSRNQETIIFSVLSSVQWGTMKLAHLYLWNYCDIKMNIFILLSYNHINVEIDRYIDR